MIDDEQQVERIQLAKQKTATAAWEKANAFLVSDSVKVDKASSTNEILDGLKSEITTKKNKKK